VAGRQLAPTYGADVSPALARQDQPVPVPAPVKTRTVTVYRGVAESKEVTIP
jgi:hypothetical protein